jgi:hypothetical protein
MRRMIIQRDMARRDWDNTMALAEERGIKRGREEEKKELRLAKPGEE